MRQCQRGITLLELMLTVALVAVLGAMAVPAYVGYIDRARVTRAIGEIGAGSIQIYKWRTIYGRFPETLAEANIELPADPWGAVYEYTNIATAGPADVRRDKNLRPVNSDFDLYSRGADGLTVKPFTAKKARDDVVRANNGGFIGLAEDY